MSLWYTHALASVRHHLSTIFKDEFAWPIKAKFHVEPPRVGGTKVYINDPGQMTKMAATPIVIMVKILKIFSRTKKSCDLETLHAALGTQTLQSLCK